MMSRCYRSRTVGERFSVRPPACCSRWFIRAMVRPGGCDRVSQPSAGGFMTRRALVGFLFVTGCVINKADNPPNPDGNQHGSDGTIGSVVPQGGVWHYDEVTPVSNTCGSNITQFEDGNFVIDQASLAGFRIVPADGTAPFQCSLSGTGFDCPNRADRVEDLRPSVDAVVTVHATANGNFQSSTHGTGQQHANLSCGGS